MRVLILGLLCTLYVTGQNPDPVMGVGGGGGSGGGSGTVTEVTGSAGITCVNGTSTPDCSLDRTVAPFKATAAGTPTMAGQLTGDIAVDTSASPDRFYICGADDGTDCTAVIRIAGYAEMLPLAGGTLTGQLITDNLGIEFEESDTNPTCAAGNFNIYADASENKLKACQNGTPSDLVGGSGGQSTLLIGQSTNASVTNDANTRYQKQRSIAWTTTADTADNTSYYCPFTGTLSNLRIHFTSAGTNDNTYTYTLRVAGSDTALVIVPDVPSGAKNYIDSTHTASCTAGDRIVLKLSQAAGTGALGALLDWSVLLVE